MKRLVLVSGATLLAGALFATGSLADPPMTSASEVRWGGRAFFGPAELSEWLSGHGLSYDAWAKNHPRAAARLEGREQRETAPTTAPAASPAASRVASPAPAQATAAPRDASRTSGAFLLRSLATLAAALLVLALLPALHLRQVRLPSVLERHQLELAGGGVAIALALAAAHLV
jgi:hypothetical protein